MKKIYIAPLYTEIKIGERDVIAISGYGETLAWNEGTDIDVT